MTDDMIPSAFADWFDREVETGIKFSDNVTASLGHWSERREAFIRDMMRDAFVSGYSARADVADARVAAAYKDAARRAFIWYAGDNIDSHEIADDLRAAVLEDTPADAQAALDRRIAEAVEAERERCIRAVNKTAVTVEGTPYSVGGRAFAAAIRAGE